MNRQGLVLLPVPNFKLSDENAKKSFKQLLSLDNAFPGGVYFAQGGTVY